MRRRSVCLWLVVAVPAVADPPRLTPAEVTPAFVRASFDRGLAFLLKTQNPDGSWGGAADSLTTWSGDT